MSYIGSTPATQSFIAGTDYFNGDGTTVNFTLSRSVNSVNDIEVIVNNVEQIPSGYSVSGTTLTFSAAPSSGTSNVYVRYLSTTNLSLAIPAGTITPTAVSDQLNSSTGYFDLPSGTTAQRPGSPSSGATRFNTSGSVVEVYTGTAWQTVGDQTGIYTVEYLVVAGGGGGGNAQSGGGGAGGYRTATGFSVTFNSAITVTVGAGGATGTIGSDSVFSSITSTGGGLGGRDTIAGGNGGSGGGGGFNSSFTGAASRLSGGSATAGQGNAGGYGEYNGFPVGGGGGGGAGAAGANYNVPANGGVGLASSISGSSTFYAGGGGGGGRGITVGSGGNGGGGAGSDSTNGTAGTANRGGGGGGSTGGFSGGAGGSGIVIISYLGAQRGTGGTVTSSGGYTIHTFTSSGTYTA